MPAVKKRRHTPANDPRPLSSHRMSYVALPRPYWNARRLSVACVLGVFTGILGLAGALNAPYSVPDAPPAVMMQAEAPAAPAAAVEKPQPYDIVINASELAPPGQAQRLAAVAEKLPIGVIMPREVHAVPQDMTVVAGDSAAKPAPAPMRDEAAFQDSVARNLAQHGDVRQALRFEHRAAELAPANMLYRYALAILYDRISDRQGAAMLYRQVLAAYADSDSSLPRALRIEDVRARADYLVAMDSR